MIHHWLVACLIERRGRWTPRRGGWLLGILDCSWPAGWLRAPFKSPVRLHISPGYIWVRNYACTHPNKCPSTPSTHLPRNTPHITRPTQHPTHHTTHTPPTQHTFHTPVLSRTRHPDADETPLTLVLASSDEQRDVIPVKPGVVTTAKEQLPQRAAERQHPQCGW